MSVDMKVPEIRFKGFIGDWNSLCLDENARFTKGQGYSKGDLVKSGSPIILYGRLYTKFQTVIVDVDTFVTEGVKSIKSIGGEVIVPASGESPEDISRAAVVSEPNVILGGDLNVVYPNKEINSIFLALSISNGRLKKELSSKAQGKSVVHIRNSDLGNLDLILPSEYEQTAIGNTFQKFDSLINQHQQKHDKLSSIKKAMLEKMFPKQGETTPEIRFKGFSGEWEEIRLADFGAATSGKSIESEFSINGKYKVISIGSYSENSVYTDQGIRASLSSKTEGRVLNKNDLTMILNDKTLAGNIIGRVLFINENDSYVYNQRTQRIEPNHEYDSHFLYQLLNSPLIRQKIFKSSQGNTQIYVNWSAIKELKYLVPKKEEQTAIGNTFQKLDSLINQHQQQITKLTNIKQACLNKMFV